LQKNIIPRLKLRRLPSRIAGEKRSVARHVLRVINYKFYLSPGYGLTLMKRKMSSACDRQKRGCYKGRNLSSSRANFFASAHRKRDACDAVLTIRAQEFKKIEVKNRFCLLICLLKIV